MRIPRALCFGLVLLAAPACRGTGETKEPSAPVRTQAELDAEVRAGVEARLRAMFPEVTGELTRAAIARALLTAAPLPGEMADAPSRAIVAIRRGDVAGARNILGALLAAEEVERATKLVAQGDDRGALAALDRAVAIAPDDADLRCRRGEVELRLAERDRDHDFARAALDDFSTAARRERSARAWLGASRAARILGDSGRALEYARSGVEALASSGSMEQLAPAPERTLAEASLVALDEARTGGDANVLEARHKETIGALEGLIGHAPEDGWAWRELAGIHLADGDLSRARDVAYGGLKLFPDDRALHERYARATFELGGRAVLIAAYETFRAQHPRSSLAHWYLAHTRFGALLEDLVAKRARPEAFEEAESGFRESRTLDAANADACRAYEALCRTGAGWSRLESGDLDGARNSFLATEDVQRGGLKAEVPGSLRSAAVGLETVGAAFNARSRTSGEYAGLQDLERAARIYDYLHEYDPENASWANNAGFFDRDTAIALRIDALQLADKGEIDEANRRLARARELMEKSFAAYTTAAHLAPDDVRFQNDTGLILTYYLQRDVPVAEAYLQKAIALGEAQVPLLRARAEAPGIDAKERESRERALEEVESAMGDAYQNMGVLHLTLKSDAKTALEWLEKSLKIGPDPREEVRVKGGYLDQCREAIETGVEQKLDDKTRWGAPVKKPR